MNNDFNCKTLKLLLDPKDESSKKIFTDDFWNEIDFVVNAVDDEDSRKYIDSRCVWYEKPLFES